MTTKRSSKASQQLELDVVTTGTRAANKVLAEGLDRGRKSGQGYEVSSLPTDAPPIVRVRVEDPAKKHGFRAARFISTSSAYCTTDEIAELLPGRPGFIGRCRLELLLEG